MMPLPKLTVLGETYCSQQVADTAVDYVETHRPELIEAMMAQEHWRQQDYSERAWVILGYLTKARLEVPTSLIGRMDLINEFTRRGRRAYGKSEIPPKGHPLAPGPDQPLPPLIRLDIDEGTKQRITQEMGGRILQITFDRRPDLWLAFSEEHRQEVLLDAPNQFRDLLRQVRRGTPGPEQYVVEWTFTTKPSRASFECAASMNIRETRGRLLLKPLLNYGRIEFG